MGANGSAEKGTTNTEEGREYKTVYSIGENIKVLEPKDPKKGIKLPEESHTPNRIYATFYKNGHDVKAIAVYGDDCKKLYEIHTVDHKGLGAHYHVWENGKPIEVHSITPQMQALLDKVRNFNPE
jgi:hypothetical protein